MCVLVVVRMSVYSASMAARRMPARSGERGVQPCHVLPSGGGEMRPPPPPPPTSFAHRADDLPGLSFLLLIRSSVTTQTRATFVVDDCGEHADAGSQPLPQRVAEALQLIHRRRVDARGDEGDTRPPGRRRDQGVDPGGRPARTRRRESSFRMSSVSALTASMALFPLRPRRSRRSSTASRCQRGAGGDRQAFPAEGGSGGVAVTRPRVPVRGLLLLHAAARSGRPARRPCGPASRGSAAVRRRSPLRCGGRRWRCPTP